MVKRHYGYRLRRCLSRFIKQLFILEFSVFIDKNFPQQLCAEAQLLRESNIKVRYLPIRYSSMPFAATLPAPMAEITVAAPVTASPPA